jgi:ABC-2 type transport system ATP-binding protein
MNSNLTARGSVLAGRDAGSLAFSAMVAEQAAPVFEVKGIVKRYGDRVALKDVGFEADRGELLAIIGPNGAGKTTLLSILAGILRPDAGQLSRLPGEVGWVPQQMSLYRRLTVAENLRLFARLEKVADVEATVAEMLDATRLGDRKDDLLGRLSGGNQQRVNIAVGLLARPPVLLLDEPSAGLDPRQREVLWEFVSRLAGGGTTVVFSTHNIQEAERFGNRLLVLADGERLFDGTADELRSTVAAEAGEAESQRDFEHAFVSFLHHRGH